MPVLNVADVQILLEDQQRTTPSLKLMDELGQIYYAAVREGDIPGGLKIFDGDKIYTVGDADLFFSATSVNSCDTVTLPAGRYGVRISGGRGGDGGNNTGSGVDGAMYTYGFMIDSDTTITYFRGGNGNAGGVSSNGDAYAAGGGGASGAASMVYVNGVATIAQGGQGGAGGSGTDINGEPQSCGGGGGGGTDGDASGITGFVNASLDSSMVLCGGGGGGAPAGAGGAADSGGWYSASAGAAGTEVVGGAGGDTSRLLGGGTGGAAGATVSFSCANQTLYSYGGGGGGALSYGGLFNLHDLAGGDGGSGVSDTHSNAVIEIYKYVE